MGDGGLQTSQVVAKRSQIQKDIRDEYRVQKHRFEDCKRTQAMREETDQRRMLIEREMISELLSSLGVYVVGSPQRGMWLTPLTDVLKTLCWDHHTHSKLIVYYYNYDYYLRTDVHGRYFFSLF